MNINLSKPAWFAAAVIVQIAIVVGLIVVNESLLIRGTQVMLAIHPVDPTDPLRGDYVTFNYDISAVNIDLADNKDKLSRIGATAYVILVKNGDHWEASSVKSTKPGDGQLFIKGIVNYVDYDYSSSAWERDRERDIHITYGIEDYFVPEGTGSGIVSQIRTQQALAQVVIDRDGNSVLKSIIFGADITENPQVNNAPVLYSNQTQGSDNPVNETDLNNGIKATNTSNTASQSANPPGVQNWKYVKLVKPNGGQIICLGQQTEIAWESSGLDSVGLRLEKEEMDGSSYYYIGLDSIKATADESGTPGKGSAYWVPQNIPAGDAYKLEITGLGSDAGVNDRSDSVFSIADCNQ